MKLLRLPKSILSQICLILGINFFCVCLVHPNTNYFDECFTKDFLFNCTDTDLFLQQMGINIDKNIIRMADLHRIDYRKLGCHKGSFYADRDNVEYFVKEGHILREFIAGKLLNGIVARNSAIIKVVEDQKRTIASKKIQNFIRQKEIAFSKNTKIIDEVLLDITQDFLGIIDRSKRNMGYIPQNDNTFLAARVDYDGSFHFGKHRYKNLLLNKDHLNLYLLEKSIEKHPKKLVIEALEKIVQFSDQEIIMDVFECWATLNKIGIVLHLESIMNIGQQLIERKKAFHKKLNDLISTQNTNSGTGKIKSQKIKSHLSSLPDTNHKKKIPALASSGKVSHELKIMPNSEPEIEAKQALRQPAKMKFKNQTKKILNKAVKKRK